MTLRFLKTIAICLSLSFLWSNLAAQIHASAPQKPLGVEHGVVGIASNALDCLAVGDNVPVASRGVVNLNWQGQAVGARLILAVTGSEAEHTIKVNDQAVAQVPVQPTGRACSHGEDSVTFYLDVPLDLIKQGENSIEITNDALMGDAWTAAYVRLEVQGDLVLDQSDRGGPIRPTDVTAAISAFTFSFTNSYDNSSQQARAQIPDAYTAGQPTPLLIAVHPRTGSMFFGENEFGPAANAKTWLLASPELHGSWPATASPQPSPPGAYAYASLEGQYDIVGAVKYMIDHYNVDSQRIYLAGYSMGAQTATVTAAKNPHIFAAVFDNKGPSDMVVWYDQQVTYYGGVTDPVRWMERECHIGQVRKTPTQNPFCYQRRSSLNFASNYIHLPISLTHSVSDQIVPISHSRNLRNTINSFGPVQVATLFEENSGNPAIDGGSGCGFHCFEPDPVSVLNFLEPYRLSLNPARINIATDQSKEYYWLKFSQSGGDHWSRVEASYNAGTKTVSASVTDPQALTLGFNLGPTFVSNSIRIPGLSFPAGTYEVTVQDGSGQKSFTLPFNGSGYLNVTTANVGGSSSIALRLVPGSSPFATVFLPAVFKLQK